MTNGRGAWNNAGAGGTKKYNDATKPGPYYFLGSGELDPNASQDNYAVRAAVKAYQRALNRRLGAGTVKVDGKFGPTTEAAVKKFQQANAENLTVWGGIGPDTSMLLLLPDLARVVAKERQSSLLNPAIVSGIIRHESGWDTGAVGFVDNQDLGLAQINGPAHPDLTADQRLQPIRSFEFIVAYMNNAIREFQGGTGTDPAFKRYGIMGDAIASYNLGIGGAHTWVKQGRPQMFTPSGTSVPRDVWAYIDSVLGG